MTHMIWDHGWEINPQGATGFDAVAFLPGDALYVLIPISKVMKQKQNALYTSKRLTLFCHG